MRVVEALHLGLDLRQALGRHEIGVLGNEPIGQLVDAIALFDERAAHTISFSTGGGVKCPHSEYSASCRISAVGTSLKL